MQMIHAVFQNDGKWFIARCLDVPVTTQGRTLTAAKKNLREAVELYIETWLFLEGPGCLQLGGCR
jgi:predicted RNase H-like HicB family nuclease